MDVELLQHGSLYFKMKNNRKYSPYEIKNTILNATSSFKNLKYMKNHRMPGF